MKISYEIQSTTGELEIPDGLLEGLTSEEAQDVIMEAIMSDALDALPYGVTWWVE